MKTTVLSSREFNQRAGDAKKAANEGPVFITDRGRPAHVLMTYDEYQRITGGLQNIAEALAMPGVEDVEFEVPKLGDYPRPADLS